MLNLRSGRPISPSSLSTSDQEADPALSMDGRVLLFSSDRNGTSDLFGYDLGANRYLDMSAFDTLADESQPRFVGGQDQVVTYVSTSSGAPALYLASLQGGR
jgi:Tol biopolymer transport system component